jgi:uncharacterized membrane protein YtjA (UPF0391 family)
MRRGAPGGQTLSARHVACPANPTQPGVTIMLYWAIVFLVVALVAALFGFTGIAVGAASIAKILFVVFIILFILSLLFGGLRRGPRI